MLLKIMSWNKFVEYIAIFPLILLFKSVNSDLLKKARHTFTWLMRWSAGSYLDHRRCRLLNSPERMVAELSAGYETWSHGASFINMV